MRLNSPSKRCGRTLKGASVRQCVRQMWLAMLLVLLAFTTLSSTSLRSFTAAAAEPDPPKRVVMLVHGGCGVLERAQMTPELEAKYRADLTAALRAGHAVLSKPDGTSLDAVVAAIKVLEDSPLFNAGKGAVFTREGRNELDASIMDGRTRDAGAVASVTTVKNPITAARAVMEKSGHVLMVGPGAERFARDSGLEMVENSYFWTQFRWNQYQAALKAEGQRPPEGNEKTKQSSDQQSSLRDARGVNPEQQRARPAAIDRFGTVGAVAVDQAGNIAAGTSTGGLNMKRGGRVGDSPIIGAGNFADNESCAISSTGDGEYFLRAVAAHEISALVRYKGLSLSDAADEVIQRRIKTAGGDGAVIVINCHGEWTVSFNTEGMYRGYITRDGQPSVFIYER